MGKKVALGGGGKVANAPPAQRGVGGETAPVVVVAPVGGGGAPNAETPGGSTARPRSVGGAALSPENRSSNAYEGKINPTIRNRYTRIDRWWWGGTTRTASHSNAGTFVVKQRQSSPVSPGR